jgi:N-carbamoyl-L-amino-acid hydrolase
MLLLVATLAFFFLAGLARADSIGSGGPQPLVNRERLLAHLKGLSQFGKNADGGVSRVGYTDADLAGRKYAMELMNEAGLKVSIDFAGNIVGSRDGTDPTLLPILIGSHIDSVPHGGNFDGDLGSLAGIEVAQTLRERQQSLRHPLQVIIFENEEGRCIGSKAIFEGLPNSVLDSMTNQSGRTVRAGIRFIGGDPSRLKLARRQPGSIAGYLELHVEQGGILDKENIPIGVVEGIVGIYHTQVEIDGFANHAGTTPMDERHDALLAAAQLIEALHRIITSQPGRQVGTVGQIRAWPNANNVIAGKVVISLEIRDLDANKIADLFRKVQKEAENIAQSTATKISFFEPLYLAPALTDPYFRALIGDSARDLGLTSKPLPSGAGHDSEEASLAGPMGMIFVPSVGGISHAPQEYTRPADIGNGANVLLRSLIKLDNQAPPYNSQIRPPPAH